MYIHHFCFRYPAQRLSCRSLRKRHFSPSATKYDDARHPEAPDNGRVAQSTVQIWIENWWPRTLWDDLNLAPVFLTHGYRLWPSSAPPYAWFPMSPDSSWEDRVFDGFAYNSPYNTEEEKPQFSASVDISLG